MSTSPIDKDELFDVREIPCRVKHPLILERWNNLAVGESFVLMNDHDPVPLRYQFEALFPGAFTWAHLMKGPEVYQVRITRLAQNPAGACETPAGGCGGH